MSESAMRAQAVVLMLTFGPLTAQAQQTRDLTAPEKAVIEATVRKSLDGEHPIEFSWPRYSGDSNYCGRVLGTTSPGGRTGDNDFVAPVVKDDHGQIVDAKFPAGFVQQSTVVDQMSRLCAEARDGFAPQ